ncbi:hypothetical protein [Neisseria montereyensis]|uniref:Uncharacterized protein n=1 Tax=Neisseria montereyensis TaxID=2973938 RepID=A0ABT2FAC7_9NEIS|nr:hypothetical protein [Neisseria montereyensis]MCS4532895.1 hypothetical protein [Neisseria montereyensis]
MHAIALCDAALLMLETGANPLGVLGRIKDDFGDKEEVKPVIALMEKYA